MISNDDVKLDDAVFELPTIKLIQPLSIVKLESDSAAVSQEMEEDDCALHNPNLPQHPSLGPHEGPPNTDEDLLMAQATDLKTFQEWESYKFRVDSSSDSESVLEDSDVEDEADDETDDATIHAISDIAVDGRFDQ